VNLVVYLAGQIHDDWRERLREKAQSRGLDCTFVGPQTDHDLSDAIGERILGEQPSARWKDEVASEMNNLRTRVLMNRADVVIALFGEKWRQWNTAMDASLAVAMGKPVILIRPPEHTHALKELSNRAQVTVETVDQALEALAYITV
jgi:YtoQ family protein